MEVFGAEVKQAHSPSRFPLPALKACRSEIRVTRHLPRTASGPGLLKVATAGSTNETEMGCVAVDNKDGWPPGQRSLRSCPQSPRQGHPGVGSAAQAALLAPRPRAQLQLAQRGRLRVELRKGTRLLKRDRTGYVCTRIPREKIKRSFCAALVSYFSLNGTRKYP